MELLNISSVGFIVVFLGTLFLFGELLVKAKGIFVILGTAIMTVYFVHHLSSGVGVWVLLLYIIGLMLILIDGKIVNDGTIAIIGIILMILGLAIPSPGFIYGALVSMGLIVGAAASFLFLKIFPKRNMWSKMTLKERLTSEAGYNSINETYIELVGKKGRTLTPFRPIGTIEIEGKQYSATSERQWLEANEEVKVISVDGTRILVAKDNMDTEAGKR